MRNFSILVAVVLVLGLGYWGVQDRKASAPEAPLPAVDSIAPAPAASEIPTTAPDGNKVTVVFQNGAFTPAVVNVKVGDTVTWVNKHISAIRVVSNPHPFHTSYPALDSDTVDPGSSYSFTFKEKVTVNYHNHFNPGVTGQVVVE